MPHPVVLRSHHGHVLAIQLRTRQLVTTALPPTRAVSVDRHRREPIGGVHYLDCVMTFHVV